MLEDELNVLIYLIVYPMATIFNIFSTIITEFVNLFICMFASVVGMINALHTAVYGLVCIALPAELAVFVLLLVYILAMFFIIKMVKLIWDVLPFV